MTVVRPVKSGTAASTVRNTTSPNQMAGPTQLKTLKGDGLTGTLSQSQKQSFVNESKPAHYDCTEVHSNPYLDPVQFCTLSETVQPPRPNQDVTLHVTPYRYCGGIGPKDPWKTFIHSVCVQLVECHLQIPQTVRKTRRGCDYSNWTDIFLLVPCIWTGGEPHFTAWLQKKDGHLKLRDLVFQFIRDVYHFHCPFDGTITILEQLSPHSIFFTAAEKQLYIFDFLS